MLKGRIVKPYIVPIENMSIKLFQTYSGKEYIGVTNLSCDVRHLLCALNRPLLFNSECGCEYVRLFVHLFVRSFVFVDF